MELIDLLNFGTQTVNSPTWIPDFGSCSPALLDFFLSFESSISSKVAFPPLSNSDYVAVSVSIDFPSNGDVTFHCTAFNYSCPDWKGLYDHLKEVFNRINVLPLYWSPDRLVAITKRVLELPNLFMLIKQESIISQKLGSHDFWQIANSDLKKR